MSKEGKSIKVNAIVSSVPPIAFFTLGIYPFVIAIMLFVNSDQFKNKGLAIAIWVLMLFVLPIILFVPLILACCLKSE